MTSERIRVLHIVLNVHEGGLERVLGDLARGLDRTAFEQHILALEFLGRLAKGLEACATLHVAERGLPGSLIWPRRLARQVRRIAPGIVHTHSGVWFKGTRAARMAGVPFVVHTDHGRQSPDPWSHRMLDGMASRRTDVVIAVSQVLAEQLVHTVVHDASRVRVIRNGVDTERFRRIPDDGILRRELKLAPEEPIIGSIGRLDPIKRFDLMIQAFAELLRGWNDGPSPTLVIAGDGPERAKLSDLITALGLDGKVHLLGWRDDVQTLHGAFTIFTLSSRSEGTSIGLLEAMSANLCPVVTDVGGNAAVLGDALQHRLCTVEDGSALRGAWEAALADPDRRHRDGMLARQRVEQSFSLRSMIREHEQLYRAARNVGR